MRKAASLVPGKGSPTRKTTNRTPAFDILFCTEEQHRASGEANVIPPMTSWSSEVVVHLHPIRHKTHSRQSAREDNVVLAKRGSSAILCLIWPSVYCYQLSDLNLKHGFYFYRNPSGQRAHPHRRTSPASFLFSKDFYKKVGYSVDHLHMIGKIRSSIHHA